MRKLCAVLVLAFFSAYLDAGIETPKVTTDKSYDVSTMASIIKSVVKPEMTNDEKAIAIYDFCRTAFYHFRYPAEENAGIGPLKDINVYGWSLCGGLHTVLGELYKEAGFKYRYRGWSNPGHTTIEVFYDGKWHYLDTFLCFYAWDRDRKTLVGQDDIKEDASLALKAAEEKRGPPNILSCGDTAEGVVSGVNSSTVATGWGGPIAQTDGVYNTDFTLMRGESLELKWGRESEKSFYGYFETNFPFPQHTCNIKDFRSHPVQGPILEHYGQRCFANGRLTYSPDLTNAAFTEDLLKNENLKIDGGKLLPAETGKPLILIFKMACPYVIVDSKVSVDFTEEDAGNKVEYASSLDGKWEDVSSLAEKVKGTYVYFVKISTVKGIKALKAVSVVQHNRSVQPFLINGENKASVTVKNAASLGKNKLLVSYAFEEAAAKQDRKQFNGKDIEYSAEKAVTKEIDKSPFDFSIYVGGNTPPKMKYLRYEVR